MPSSTRIAAAMISEGTSAPPESSNSSRVNLPERPVSSMQPMMMPAAATAAVRETVLRQVSEQASTKRLGPMAPSFENQLAMTTDTLAPAAT